VRRVGKLHVRWLLAAGDRLARLFKVVEVDIRSIDIYGAGQIVWLIEQLAFSLEISVIAFDEGVLVDSLEWTDLWVDPQTLEKTQHGRGKIIGSLTTDPKGVAI
jgi:hypothetical protein